MCFSRDEEIAKITWTLEDVELLFNNHGISFTDENIDIFLNQRARKTLEEISIERGWDVLEDILSSCKNQMK